MMKIRNTLHKMILLIIAACAFSSAVYAVTAEELQADGTQSLQALYKTIRWQHQRGKSARAILVFPHIIKAGFVFSGGYGEGVLTKHDKFDGYFP